VIAAILTGNDMSRKAQPRRKRSVNVCTLDNATISRLTTEFTTLDTEGTGALLPAQIEVLIKQSYAPTPEELANVFNCLNINDDDVVEFDEFLFGFYRIYKAFCETPGQEFEDIYNEYAAELNFMAKQGSTQRSEDIAFSPEVFAAAMEELGEESVAELRRRFCSFSPDGGIDDKLARDDMAKLLKAVFTPSEEKIGKVMMFFDMSGEGEGITLMNFVNGMTLLYGDLGHLAASPKKMGPISPLSSPSGEYAPGSASPFSLVVDGKEEELDEMESAVGSPEPVEVL